MVVPDAVGTDSISAIALGCGEPWNLTQDCSVMSGAKKKLLVSGVKIGVAGSEDGKTTLLMGGFSGATSNSGYEAAKAVLLERGIAIESVVPVVSSGTVFGYIFQTDVPSYHIWEEYVR